MPQLYDEPIRAEINAAGTPAAFHWRGGRMHVRSVLAVWQAPGDGRLYRVGVTTAGGEPGVAEIADGLGGWRLRHLWT